MTSLFLSEYLKSRQEIINRSLKEIIPSEKTFPSTIHRSMRYSLMAGGKRLRPILAIASAESVGGKMKEVLPLACAIEMIHTYSLIHDDLPAMDNDDLRRGMPTSHKVFGEGIAVLAGDALLTHAFIIMSDPAYGMGISPEDRLIIINELSRASGTQGMIGGQVLDLEAQGRNPGLEELSEIHRLKTGCLITVSVRIGAIAAGARKDEIEALSEYGQYLGLAFQITDDILDLEGSEKDLGKPAKSDIASQKATYPALMGIPESKERARQAIEKAVSAIDSFDKKAEPLRLIARYTIKRKG